MGRIHVFAVMNVFQLALCVWNAVQLMKIAVTTKLIVNSSVDIYISTHLPNDINGISLMLMNAFFPMTYCKSLLTLTLNFFLNLISISNHIMHLIYPY